jgi:hypothetical protein
LLGGCRSAALLFDFDDEQHYFSIDESCDVRIDLILPGVNERRIAGGFVVIATLRGPILPTDSRKRPDGMGGSRLFIVSAKE